MDNNTETTNIKMAFVDESPQNVDFFMNMEISKFIRQKSDKNLFVDGLFYRLLELKVVVKKGDIKAIKQELRERYLDKMKLKISGKGKDQKYWKALCDWIDTSKTSATHMGNGKSRANMYVLCMALEMGIAETKAFCKKYFFTIPFNYRNEYDAAFYYGIKKEKTISEIEHIINLAEKASRQSSGTIYNTDQIRQQIDKIDDDEVFIDELASIIASKKASYKTARDEAMRLLKDQETKSYKKDEDSLYSPEFWGKRYYGGMETFLTLLYPPAFLDDLCDYLEKAVKRDRFIESLPKVSDIDRLNTGKSLSDRKIRNILILLFFYRYYSQKAYYFEEGHRQKVDIRNDEKRIKADWEEFEENLNDMLLKFHFPDIYPRQAFDCFIMFCASKKDPLKIFRDTLDCYLEYIKNTQPEIECDNIYHVDTN